MWAANEPQPQLCSLPQGCPPSYLPLFFGDGLFAHRPRLPLAGTARAGTAGHAKDVGSVLGGLAPSIASSVLPGQGTRFRGSARHCPPSPAWWLFWRLNSMCVSLF